MNKLLSPLLCLIAAALLVYTFYIPWHYFSYFVIGHDEAQGIIQSTMDFLSAGDWQHKLSHLFHTKGQHVTFGMQVTSLSLYYGIGHVDLQLYNLIGIAILAASFACIVLRNRQRSPVHFAWVVIFILALGFSPSHHSCLINTACTANHYLGIAFAIIALFCLTAPIRWPWLVASQVFFALSIFSSPAGLAWIPVSVLILWLQQRPNSHKLFHLSSLIVLSAVYYRLTATSTFVPGIAFTPDTLPGLLLKLCLYLLAMTSSFIYWPGSEKTYYLMAGLGLALLLAYGHLGYRVARHRAAPEVLFNLGGGLLLLCMMLLISLGRFLTDFGSPRYSVYASLLGVFGVLLYSQFRPSPRLPLPAFAAMALLLFVIQRQIGLAYLESLQRKIDQCNARWARDGKACGVMIKHDEATALLLEAERRGILRLPR